MRPFARCITLGIASRAVRNIARRKVRVLLAVVAISVSMAIMVSIPAGLNASQSAVEQLNDQMGVDYATQAAEIENTSSLIEVGNTGSSTSQQGGEMSRSSSGSSSEINETVMETVEALDGVESVIPYVSMTEGMPSRDDFFGGGNGTMPSGGVPPSGMNGTMPDMTSMRNMLSDVVKVLGVTLTENAISNYSVLPTTILEGRNLYANETGSVLLTENLTAYYDTELGGTVTIQNQTFTVVGIYQNTSTMGNRTVFMSIADAQEIYAMGTSVSYLYVYAENSDDVSTIASAIKLAYSDVTVSTMADRLAQLTALQEMSEKTLSNAETTLQQTQNTATQLMIIAVVATGLIILFVMLYTVKERTKEIGVLKTLGFSKRAVIAQFVLEGTIVAAIAGAVGAAIGWISSSTLSSLLLPSSTTEQAGRGVQQASSLAIQPDLTWVAIAFLLVVAMGAVGSMYPAWRASRTRPVEALKNE
ncbi:MAG: FtsX-like permease family protein [Methanomassiliicoccus sp.]|nr:FtsX-like permease family protein [Methanomassiliicoccus sp.]